MILYNVKNNFTIYNNIYNKTAPYYKDYIQLCDVQKLYLYIINYKITIVIREEGGFFFPPINCKGAPPQPVEQLRCDCSGTNVKRLATTMAPPPHCGDWLRASRKKGRKKKCAPRNSQP